MSNEKTTIAVSKTAKEKAKESKHENETWNEFIQRCTEEGPEIVEFVESNGGGIDSVTLEATEYGKIADAIEQRLK